MPMTCEPRPAFAALPMKTMLIAVGKILEKNPTYYDMTRSRFIGEVMCESRGVCNPQAVSNLFDELLLEAGLEERF